MWVLARGASVLYYIFPALLKYDVLLQWMYRDGAHPFAVRAVAVDRRPCLLALSVLLVERWRERDCVLDGAAVAVEIVISGYSIALWPGQLHGELCYLARSEVATQMGRLRFQREEEVIARSRKATTSSSNITYVLADVRSPSVSRLHEARGKWDVVFRPRHPVQNVLEQAFFCGRHLSDWKCFSSLDCIIRV